MYVSSRFSTAPNGPVYVISNDGSSGESYLDGYTALDQEKWYVQHPGVEVEGRGSSLGGGVWVQLE